MPTLVFRWLLPGLLLLGLPGYYFPLPATAQARPQLVYTRADQMPELLEGGGEAAVHEALQQGVVLPFGTPVPPAGSQVVVRFVVGTVGEVGEATMVRGLSPAVDGAVLAAVRRLPRFSAGRQGRRYVRVAFTMTVQAPGAATAAQRREAATRWQRTAQRRPGEADTAFVRRVLPLSYPSAGPHPLLSYAWRASAFGQQLFFARRGGDDNDGGTDLFVLDPYRAGTYAVQVLAIPSQGDLTDLAALFFADADHDGHQDLLALSACDLREDVQLETGERLAGRIAHYETLIWQYTAPSRTDRPQYQEDLTPRRYLDGLPAAAAVRQALARHQQRRAARATK